MKRIPLLAAVVLMLAQLSLPARAQSDTPKKPKNEITKLRKERKKSHTVKQVTVDPKKSPGKHAKNLSKNVNHEVNRESKDINHALKIKHKKKFKRRTTNAIQCALVVRAYPISRNRFELLRGSAAELKNRAEYAAAEKQR